MFGQWLHKLMNPHCEHCRQEADDRRAFELEVAREAKVCNSCEILKHELAVKTRDNEFLLSKLLEGPVVEETKRLTGEVSKPIVSRHVPWSTRRQLLESADRDRARAQALAAKPDVSNKDMSQPIPLGSNTEELEKELVENV